MGPRNKQFLQTVKTQELFFDRPTSVVPKAWIGICVLNR